MAVSSISSHLPAANSITRNLTSPSRSTLLAAATCALSAYFDYTKVFYLSGLYLTNKAVSWVRQPLYFLPKASSQITQTQLMNKMDELYNDIVLCGLKGENYKIAAQRYNDLLEIYEQSPENQSNTALWGKLNELEDVIQTRGALVISHERDTLRYSVDRLYDDMAQTSLNRDNREKFTRSYNKLLSLAGTPGTKICDKLQVCYSVLQANYRTSTPETLAFKCRSLVHEMARSLPNPAKFAQKYSQLYSDFIELDSNYIFLRKEALDDLNMIHSALTERESAPSTSPSTAASTVSSSIISRSRPTRSGLIDPRDETFQRRLTSAERRTWRYVSDEEQLRKGKNTIAKKIAIESIRTEIKGFDEADKRGFTYIQDNNDLRLIEEPVRTIGRYKVGVCHYIGRRPTMEDEDLTTEIQIQIGSKKYSVALFAVFDGHGGNFAARYLKKHLALRLKEYLELFNPHKLSDEGIWNALKITFAALQKELKDYCATLPGSPEENKDSIAGTVSSLLMVLDGNLWAANVGDSRIVLENGPRFHKQMTEDQKPETARFKKSIEKQGGKVIGDRISFTDASGREISLGCGRALGDLNVQGVPNRPKISKCPLKDLPKGSKAYICCDGIWDVASSKQIVNGARRDSPSMARRALNIVGSAFKAYSRDNLTAIAVDLSNAV